MANRPAAPARDGRFPRRPRGPVSLLAVGPRHDGGPPLTTTPARGADEGNVHLLPALRACLPFTSQASFPAYEKRLHRITQQLNPAAVRSIAEMKNNTVRQTWEDWLS